MITGGKTGKVTIDVEQAQALVGQDAIVFFVHGVPAPKGSTKSFNHSRTGKVITLPDAKNIKEWSTAVRLAATQAMVGKRMFERPVRLSVRFQIKRPKKPKFALPAVRPDLSKLVRAIEDPMNGIVWTDDSLVCDHVLSKRYDDLPGAAVYVQPIPEKGNGR